MEANDTYTTEEKVNFIKHMFRFYQPVLTIAEQITLLDSWEESCVNQEEYEMAQVIKEEMEYILKNPKKVPQRIFEVVEASDNITEEVTKTSLFKRIVSWFKNLF